MRINKIGARKPLRVAAVLGIGAASVLTLQSASSAAAGLTVSPAYGGSGTSPIVQLVGAGFKTGTTNLISAVQFQTGTSCGTSGTGTAATLYSVASATKITAKVPALTDTNTAGVHTKKDYLVCVYKTGVTAALAQGKYTAYPAPTFTSIDTTKGPVGGGNTVAVVGTNFTAKTTATIGGNALTSIKVATDGLSFTGVVPAHAAATGTVISITDEGGTVTGGGTTYDFVSAISVSPSTIVYNLDQSVEILGKGFNALSFGAAGNNASAHVYLVDGVYAYDTDTSGTKDNGQAFECKNVQVESDTALTCDMNAATDSFTKGVYTVTVVDDGSVATGPTYQTALTSGATVTVADF